MLAATLHPSLVGNMLAGKGVVTELFKQVKGY